MVMVETMMMTISGLWLLVGQNCVPCKHCSTPWHLHRIDCSHLTIEAWVTSFWLSFPPLLEFVPKPVFRQFRKKWDPRFCSLNGHVRFWRELLFVDMSGGGAHVMRINVWEFFPAVIACTFNSRFWGSPNSPNCQKMLELSVKSSKDSTETMSLLKTRNKVVEVEWVYNKVEHEEGTTVGSKLGTST
jgi:hypothetical protein